ncbi:MAG: hypothetical protein LBJ76_04235 [Candidatus Accumulibacter sp.]|jgi:hypothetical protein|nr:hypothetical protein [Accumulibacter sp.]
MIEIPLEAIPNQALSVTIEESFFEIHLQTLDNGAVAVSIQRDTEPVILGVRAMPNRRIIPYRNLEGGSGNFFFLCPNGSYPAYEGFGTRYRLLYANDAELEGANIDG